MGLREQIIDNEKALLSIEVRSSVEKLRLLISADFIEIGSSGNKFGLKEVLELLPQETNWSAKAGDFEFRLLSDYIVQLIYKAFIKKDEQDEGIYSLRTSIWKKEKSTWKIIFHQGTKVSPFEFSP